MVDSVRLRPGLVESPVLGPRQKSVDSRPIEPGPVEKFAANTAAEQAAKQFEALLLEQMFKSMWANIPTDGMFSGGREEEYFRDMLNEALAESVSKGQGIGIKDIVLREINKKD